MKEFLVSGLRQLVEKTADEFEPGELNLTTAERAVAEWATIERVACSAKLRAAGRAEDIGLDAAQAVSNSSGITSGQARKQTRLHRKLHGKQRTTEEFNKGKLSPTQADAIADAVDANPQAENALLDLAASGSAADLLSECERVKRDALDADGSLAAKQRQARSLRSWVDSMGMTCLSGRLEPIVGAKLLAELERRADRKFREQVRGKVRILDSQEQRMADALADVVDSCNSNGKRRGPRTVVQIHVTKSAVDRGSVAPGEKCQTAQGRPIPMGAVDDALLDPDTRVDEVNFDAVDVRSISTNTRYVPARLQDALMARGYVCEVPGCGQTKGLQRDHLDDFAQGGPTTQSNFGWKCHYHHTLKSRRLYDLVTDEDGVKHWVPTSHQARAPNG